MKASNFLVVLLAVVCLVYAGCEKSEQKVDTENGTSATEQTKEDVSQAGEGIGEKVEEAVEGAVEKTEEMHEAQVEELNQKAPAELAAELWKLIHTEGYQMHWKQWPGRESVGNVTTYVNGTAYDAIEKGEGELPPGSIIVEDKYSEEKQLESVKASINLGGNNSEDGGWFWAEYSPDGSPLAMEKGGPGITMEQ